MTPVVVTALLVVANLMGTGMMVPQVIRLHRVRSADGVSGVWIGVGIAMNSWWATYGLVESLWGILPVSIIATLLYLVMAHQFLGLVGRPGWRPLTAGTVVVGLAPLPALVVGGITAAGLVAGLAYAVQFAPAAVAALRSHDPRGASPVTWLMALTEAVIWVIYGADSGDAALIIGGTGGALAAAVILARLGWLAQRRAGTRGEHPSKLEALRSNPTQRCAS